MNLMLVLAAEESTSPPNPVIPEINEVLWAAIFFVVLWVVMKYVLLPPVVRAMENRSAIIQGDRDATDAAVAALGATRRDYEAALSSARTEASDIIADARARADERHAFLQAQADNEIVEMRRNAQADIDQARANALAGMRGDVSNLAVTAAGAVLGRRLDADSQRAIIDRALAGE